MNPQRRALLAGIAALVAACKRNKDPIVPEIWDEAPVPERADALGKLAPPWPAPARATLDSGLLTYWLRDPGATTAHVRLMMPDHADGQPLAALAVRSVGGALRHAVRRGLGRVPARLRQTRRPGRLELSVSGPAADLPRIAVALARPLARTAKNNRGLPASLLQARARATRDAKTRTTLEIATAAAVASLFDVSLDSQRVDSSRAELQTGDQLTAAWTQLLDPRRCVMVIHAPQAPEELPSLLAAFSGWTGEGRREALESSLARLRWTARPIKNPQHLMTDDGAPLLLPSEGGSGSGKLVMACRLGTPTVQARANARLAQRLLAETQDARLAISGPVSVFTISTAVSEKSIESRAQGLVEALAGGGKTRAPSQRLFTAAQLWLGARVVQASLEGEDWTALWSEAMDLASTESDIPRALASDATAMLSVQPELLTTWMGEQLDPRLGKNGWAWALCGANEKMERSLSRVADSVTVPPHG
ncbi:MAG: hypothetical protein ACRBN8_18075 [Nannocystales bacterium]